MSELDQATQAFQYKFNTLLARAGLLNRPTTQANINAQTTPAALTTAANVLNELKAKPSTVKGSSSRTGKGMPVPGALNSDSMKELFVKLAKSGELKSGVQSPLEKFVGTAKQVAGHSMGILSAVPAIGDILSRPAYAVNAALQQGLHAVNSGEPIWSLGDDLGYGLWRGISGQQKAGFGNVVAESAKLKNGQVPRAVREVMPFGLDKLYGGKALQNIQATNPTAAKWIQRGTGLAGDISVDPLSYLPAGKLKEILPGATKLAPETRAGLEAGLQTMSGYESSAKALIDKAATDYATNPTATNLERYFDASKKLTEAPDLVHGADAVLVSVEDSAKKAIKNSPLTNFKVRVKNPGTIDSWVTATDDIANKAVKAASDQAFEIYGGALRGNTSFQMRPIQANLAAEKVGELTRDAVLNRVESRIQSTINGVAKPASIAKWEKLDPLYAEWKKTAAKTLGTTTERSAFAEADIALSEFIRPEIERIQAKVYEGMKNAYLKIPEIQFMGKHIAEFPKIGEVLDRIKNVVKPKWDKGFGKVFSYTANVSDAGSNIISKANSLGVYVAENDRARLAQLAEGLSQDEINAVSRHLATDTPMAGKADALRQYIRDGYDNMWAEKNALGLAKGPPIPGYTYLHAEETARIAHPFQKAAEKGAAAKFRELPEAEKTLAKAAEMHLHATEDPIVNYMMYRLKHESAKVEASFIKDMWTQYGVRGFENVTPYKDLVKLPKGRWDYIDQAVKDGLRSGETLYIDKDINDLINNFLAMKNSAVSDVSRNLIDSVDELTRRFKALNTVYFPGYHVKNFFSDMALGAMDGVTPKDYAEVMNAAIHKNTATLKLGNEEVPFNKLWDDFRKNVGPGFIGQEIDAPKFTQGLHKFSEFREDVGRFTHFYSAMKKEYPGALEKFASKDVAYEKAIDSSVARVNKFKFDFNALTRQERKYVRRGIPFYTYLRKATPTILQSVWTNPKWLDYINRGTNSLQDRIRMGDLFPDWVWQAGGGKIVEGQHPWIVKDDLLPTNTLKSVIDMKNYPSHLNPILQDAYEASQYFGGGKAKDTFTQKPINHPWEIITGDWRGTPPIKNIYHSFTGGQKSVAEQLYSFFGIPVTQIKTDQQTGAAAHILTQLKNKVAEIDKILQKKNYSVYVSGANNQLSYAIRNLKSGKVVARFDNYDDFYKAINLLS